MRKNRKAALEYQAPAPWLSALLCTTGNSLEKGADIYEHDTDDRSFCVRACDVDGGLIGVCGAPAMPFIASGRDVIASACLSGIPNRMKIVHQL